MLGLFGDDGLDGGLDGLELIASAGTSFTFALVGGKSTMGRRENPGWSSGINLPNQVKDLVLEMHWGMHDQTIGP